MKAPTMAKERTTKIQNPTWTVKLKRETIQFHRKVLERKTEIVQLDKLGIGKVSILFEFNSYIFR
jgi:hypothetical protein